MQQHKYFLSPRLWMALALAYWAAATGLHEALSLGVVVPFKNMLGPRATEYAFVALTLGSIGVLLWLARGFSFHRAAWGRWLVLLGVAALCSVYLMVTRIEMAHFPQYTILGALLRLGGLSPTSAFLAGQCGSIVDEGRQYLLHPRFTGYFDWNDLLINSVGLCMGLLLLRHADSFRCHEWSRRVSRVAGRVCGALLALGTLALLAGLASGHVLAYMPLPAGHAPDPLPLVDGSRVLALFLRTPPEFWQPGPFGAFHVMRLGEGLVLVPLLSCLLFLYCCPRQER